ncbi:unnamed protein product [Linum tenue]|uniref:Malectin-like domain-containing protein n=1 Tax=Linum tenue TaxID=586396 RepID=A0AAV0JNL5_9ROSI|nr:unnamed protein product [Linum tenue]
MKTISSSPWTLPLVFVACNLLLLQNASSQPPDTLQWLNIDCGNDEGLPPIGRDLLVWSLDTNYTTTGTKSRLSIPTGRPETDTLRFFPDAAGKNCYSIPPVKQSLKHLIRAGFYYGNYDALGKPPTFDLHLDGRKWTTVNTSSSQEGLVYREAVYAVGEGADSIELCLIRSRDGEVPFVSSVELVPLWDGLYTEMGNESSFSLVTRTNLGGPELRTGIDGELHNRIWTRGADLSNTSVVTTMAPLQTRVENDPAIDALMKSIQSDNAQNTIFLTVDLPKGDSGQQTAYLVFYFTELFARPKLEDTRIMDIYIDGKMMTSVEAELTKCKVTTLYPITVSPANSINITLAKSNSSTLPPMVSAMEVFTRIDSSAGGDGTKSTSDGAQRRLVVASYVVFIHVVSILFISLV